MGHRLFTEQALSRILCKRRFLGRERGFYLNKRKVGANGERIAGIFLEKQGYQILQYNFRCRSGEIDLIAREGAYLVFAEVKYRRNGTFGTALEAVNVRKQRQICRTARIFLLRHPSYWEFPSRFDVVAIQGEEIFLIKNAFSYLEE